MHRPNRIYLVYVLGPFENPAMIEDLSFLEDSGVDLVSAEEKGAFYYGYTFSKKMLKKFLHYRVKERFQVKVEDISDYTQEEIDDYESTNRMYKIGIDTICSPAYKYPGLSGNNNGDVEFNLPMLPHEHQIIDNTLEYYDDMLLTRYSEEMVRTMSIVIKCAKKKFRQALVNAGVLDLVGYVQLITFGKNTFEPSVIMDEVYIFFTYYSELFDMDKVYESIYK